MRITSSHKKVPKAGLEPAHPYGHTPLKRACLPISPLRRVEIVVKIDKQIIFGHYIQEFQITI